MINSNALSNAKQYLIFSNFYPKQRAEALREWCKLLFDQRWNNVLEGIVDIKSWLKINLRINED